MFSLTQIKLINMILIKGLFQVIRLVGEHMSGKLTLSPLHLSQPHIPLEVSIGQYTPRGQQMSIYPQRSVGQFTPRGQQRSIYLQSLEVSRSQITARCQQNFIYHQWSLQVNIPLEVNILLQVIRGHYAAIGQQRSIQVNIPPQVSRGQ